MLQFKGHSRVAALIIILLLHYPSFSQKNIHNPSLSDYSYLLLLHAKDPSKSGNATAFFIRKNDKLYLITCFHVFTGLDNWSNQNKGPYDSISVRYYDSKNQVKYFTINNSDKSFSPRNFKVNLVFFNLNNLRDTFLTSPYKLKNSTPIQVTSDFLQSKQNLTPLKFEPPVISFLPRPVLGN